MRKKRIYNGNKGINLAALVVFLLLSLIHI